MNKTVEPSITLKSFSCPHCGALSHQHWFSTWVQGIEKDNPPPLFSVEEVQTRIKELKQERAEIKDEDYQHWLNNAKRREHGLVFFEKEKHPQYNRLKADNLWVSQCYSCKGVAIWVNQNMIFPQARYGEEPNNDMPEDAMLDYEEARKVLNVSPRGSAALLRLCIEKLCREITGEHKKRLDTNIATLVKEGLSPTVQQALDVVRVIGNDAVHPGQIDLRDDKDTALRLFTLVNMIVEQLITQPKLAKSLFDNLPENKRDGIKNRDKATT